jgi:hypothetical protein
MQPYPPQGASPNFMTPRLLADGNHLTVNTGITTNQMTWNLRSAFNVAALNCLLPQHEQILVGYKNLLTTHKKKLWDVNLKVDAEFRAKNGPRFVVQREAYMTQVYNYFAFPPTLMQFCDAAQAMSLESMAVKSADLDAFAARSLPVLEAVFENFFKRYDQYKLERAAWDAQYGAQYGHIYAPKPFASAVPAPVGAPAPLSQPAVQPLSSPATPPATATSQLTLPAPQATSQLTLPVPQATSATPAPVLAIP